MRYVWNETKRMANIEKHGLDFDIAERIIESSEVLRVPDNRFEYGEERQLAFTELDGVKLCLCFTVRADEYRIISLRRVHDREWRRLMWS